MIGVLPLAGNAVSKGSSAAFTSLPPSHDALVPSSLAVVVCVFASVSAKALVSASVCTRLFASYGGLSNRK